MPQGRAGGASTSTARLDLAEAPLCWARPPSRPKGPTHSTAAAAASSFGVDNGLVVMGNLGVGTISPSAKLEIVGTPGVDGIKFPDGTTQTTAAGGTSNDTGMISYFVGATCPTGWILANGATISSSGESSNLYTYIGSTYGSAGKLPDMTTAGRFIRSIGGKAAPLGTQQIDMFASHTHANGGTLGANAQAYPGSYFDVPSNTGAAGGVETRPVNYAMTPCVKY